MAAQECGSLWGISSNTRLADSKRPHLEDMVKSAVPRAVAEEDEGIAVGELAVGNGAEVGGGGECGDEGGLGGWHAGAARAAEGGEGVGVAARGGVGGDEVGEGDRDGVEGVACGVGEAATGEGGDEGGAEDHVRVRPGEADEQGSGGATAGRGVSGDEGRAEKGVGVEAEDGEAGVEEGRSSGGG